jgi:hypothetical protein
MPVYISAVIEMLEWPRFRETVAKGTPLAKLSDEHACRKS